MKKIILIIPLFIVCILLEAQVGPTISNSTGGSATLAGGGYLAWSVGEPIIGTAPAATATLTQGFLQSWPDAVKNLMLTLYLEGLFNGTNMNKARNELADEFAGNIADKITIELHNASNYSTLVYSATDLALSTDGQASMHVPLSNYGSY